MKKKNVKEINKSKKKGSRKQNKQRKLLKSNYLLPSREARRAPADGRRPRAVRRGGVEAVLAANGAGSALVVAARDLVEVLGGVLRQRAVERRVDEAERSLARSKALAVEQREHRSHNRSTGAGARALDKLTTDRNFIVLKTSETT